MPLLQLASDAALAENIRRLLAEGYPAEQARAIALDIQQRARKRSRMDSALAARTARMVESMQMLTRRRRRRRVRRLPKQVVPKAIERDYARALVAWAHKVREIMQPLVDALPELLDAAAEEQEPERMDAGEANRLHALMESIREQLRGSLNPAPVIDDIGRRLSAHNREQLIRQTNAALGADVWVSEKGLGAALEAFSVENISYWSNVSERFALDIEQKAMRAISAGQRHEAFAKELEAAFDGNVKRARLVARDQVGKMYGRINSQRQKNLGISKFIWRTVGDDDVRDEHAERNGLTYSYDNPPGGELPGEPINCRCYAEPVFDDILDEM